MKINNRLNILINEYSNFYLGSIRSESLLMSLKTLSADMVLQENAMSSLSPNIQKPKVVADRIKEVERDCQILESRLKTTKDLIFAEEGGEEALNAWVWKPELNN